MKRLYWLAAIAITIWQVRAGIGRCGTIDGGVLILPALILAIYLVRGASRELIGIFGRDNRGRKTPSAYRYYQGGANRIGA